MLKDQLQLLLKEFTTLKEKIKTKLHSQQQTITDTQTKLNESNHKLETTLRETTRFKYFGLQTSIGAWDCDYVMHH